MRTKLLLLLIIGFVLFLSAQSEASHSDIRVNVDEGEFIFKNINVAKKSIGPPVLTGIIVNNTSKNWITVTFKILAFDSSGKEIPISSSFNTFTVSFDERKKEEKVYGQPLYGAKEDSDSNSISRIEIQLKECTYPTQYFFSMIKPNASEDLHFEDNFVSIAFNISKKQIGFILRNKTDNPLIIDWNKISYVDVLNKSHKILHEGVKYIDKNNSLSPTTIPPTANIEDFVFPADNIYYTSGQYGGWREIDIFPQGPKAKYFTGKTFSVFMPMEINGTQKNYFFTFLIKDIIFLSPNIKKAKQ